MVDVVLFISSLQKVICKYVCCFPVFTDYCMFYGLLGFLMLQFDQENKISIPFSRWNGMFRTLKKKQNGENSVVVW